MSYRRSLTCLGLLVAAAACGETPYTPTTPIDAGGGYTPDVGFWGQDAAVGADAEVTEDGGAGPDSGTAADGGPEADAGTPNDAGATRDAGDDAGTLADSGTPNDAGPAVDAGAPNDAGTPNDAGFDAGFADAAAPDASPVDGGVLDLAPALTTLPLGGQVTLEVVTAAGSAPVWSVDGVVGGSASLGTIVPEADPRLATYTAPLDASGLPAARTIEAGLGTGIGVASVNLEYPQPTLTAVTPNRVSTGTNVQVVLTGTGFTSATQVHVGGYPAQAVLGGWDTLDVTLPTYASSSAGTRTVEVSNPTPGGGQASLPLEVVLTDVSVDPTLPTTIEGLFSAASVSTLANRLPQITYPEDQAVAPRNFPAPDVSWTHPGSNVCRVRMTSATVQTDIYTAVPNGANGFENTHATHPASLWTSITASVINSPQVITLVVACGSLVDNAGTFSLANDEIFESAPITYVVSTDALGGRIVYFSGLIEGLWRIDLGLSVATGLPFVGPDPTFALDTTPQCVGCHSFTANGQRMGYIADAVEWNVGVLNVSNGTPSVSVPAATGVVGDWTSMHPTEDVLLSIDLNGQLTLVDASTGQLIALVPAPTAGGLATHPVWKPDGTEIAYVAATTGPDGVADAALGEIWTMPVTRVGSTYTFGAANLVASPAVAGGTAYYPAYSPDGQWILFSQAPTGSSYDNIQAKVWLVSADGTIGPVELTNANQAAANLSNSWPRWAPQVSGTRYWIVFNSQRPYGPYNGTGPQQLWVATVDTSLMPADPSAPAIWLPGQEPFTGNLTAEWTVAY